MQKPKQPNKKNQTTLKDIAKKAGVSEMTVSRVLRNSGSITEKTRTKVMAIVDELGFVPNKIAGTLATSSSNLIAVIIPTLVNQVFNEVLSGITHSLESNGFKAVIGLSEYDSEREEALIRSMLSWRPSGMIVSSMRHTEKTQKILKKAGIPVVAIMTMDNKSVDASVGVDHIQAGAIMAHHFLERGFDRIGYIGWNNKDLTAAKRFYGFKEVLTQHNISIEGTVQFDQPVNMDLGKRGLAQLLVKHPDLNAVYFPNDIAAMGGYFHCLATGIKVPNDLAIGGFSGLNMGQLLPVPLTTVSIKRFEIGQRSAQIIMECLEGKAPAAANAMDLKLIKGGTT